MRSFLLINKHKLKFATLIGLIGFGILGFFPAFLIQEISLLERVFMFFSVAFGFTLFILSLAITTEFFKFLYRRKFYNSSDVQAFLLMNNFNDTLIDEDSKWKITLEGKKAIIKGTRVIAHNKNLKVLELLFFVEYANMSESRWKELSEIFKGNGVSFDFGAISFLIDFKKCSAIECNKRLLEVVELLLKEGFEPS
ncbi:MAG TPA: hypothetical protein VFF27_01055 [Bacteroidia bacterium]|jgi:hypothetical protein|nr:hypothetical protein [Bacteroidia bacterium]